MAAAAFAFSLAVTIKIFPLVLAIIPLVRRDWTFMLWAVVWSAMLLIALPVVCVGWTETVELYRAMFTEHLLGIVSGAMSHDIASQVSPGAFSNIGIGALVARIAAGDAFYSTPLPQWASVVQFAFNATAVAAIVFVGRGGFLECALPAADGPLPCPCRRCHLVGGAAVDDPIRRSAIRNGCRTADDRVARRDVAPQRCRDRHADHDRLVSRRVAVDDRARSSLDMAETRRTDESGVAGACSTELCRAAGRFSAVARSAGRRRARIPLKTRHLRFPSRRA